MDGPGSQGVSRPRPRCEWMFFLAHDGVQFFFRVLARSDMIVSRIDRSFNISSDRHRLPRLLLDDVLVLVRVGESAHHLKP